MVFDLRDLTRDQCITSVTVNLNLDFQNNPPITCGFDEERDCNDKKCILAAIGNYTTRAQCHDDDSVLQSEEALKFLIHFFGDLTQPLHVSNKDRGGNSAKLVYKRRQTNLHSIWDTNMVQDRMELLPSRDLAAYLITEIKTGIFKSLSKSWLSTENFTSLSSLQNSKVAIEYSIDTDQFNCQNVWAGYLEDPTRDFSTDYFQFAIPVIDIQLAKGGYRLAHHLNQIFENCDD
jgi:S1/P1 Nuclease